MNQTSFQLFETAPISGLYARGRPTYEDKIAQHIVGSIRPKMKGEKHELMVEVACGSGQATNVLAPYFHDVLATDISESQIAQAKTLSKFDHIKYEVGSAEEINAKDASADLLIAAESLHWFDLDKFYPEVRRVLKPEGCLALIGYVHPQITPKTNTGPQKQLTSRLTASMEKLIIDNTSGKLVPIYRELQKGYPKIFEAMPAKLKSKATFHHICNNWEIQDIKDFINSMILEKNDVITKGAEGSVLRKSENECANVIDDFVSNVNEMLNNSGISPDCVIAYKADFEMCVITASEFV